MTASVAPSARVPILAAWPLLIGFAACGLLAVGTRLRADGVVYLS